MHVCWHKEIEKMSDYYVFREYRPKTIHSGTNFRVSSILGFTSITAQSIFELEKSARALEK
jgi:hypothetical protein